MTHIPEEICLLKYGENTYTHEGVIQQFMFDTPCAENVCAEFKNRQRDLVIDYEHQTLQGIEAPAAGWIDQLVTKEDGLYAHIKRWSERAITYLQAGEYRYFSPVILTQESRVIALHSVALTNHPAIHGLTPLVHADTQKKESDTLSQLLSLTQTANAEKLIIKIESLIQQSNHAQKALADQLVHQAIQSGKLVKSQHDWAQLQALHDYEGFKQFLDALPSQHPGPAHQMKIQLHDQNKTHNSLNEETLHILRMSGCTEEQISQIQNGAFNV